MNLAIEIKENPVVCNPQAVLVLVVGEFLDIATIRESGQFLNRITDGLCCLPLQFQHLFDRLCFPNDCVHKRYYKFSIRYVKNKYKYLSLILHDCEDGI